MAKAEPSAGGAGIGHVFADAQLLAQALTHRSAGAVHNERLEFLGDSIVNLLIAEALFQRWPKADEGALTRARAELVREGSLATLARELDLGARLTLGPGELKSGGHRRDSILADALEAVVAAIYLDAGFEACRACVLPWFESALAALPVGKPEKDPKTRLQEWLQGRQKALPSYELVSESGEEHARHFQVRCVLTDPALSAEGEGGSRRAAEQAAAAAVIAQLPRK
ncbi:MULTISPECIES: ribonuclease III [Pseudoxanthomonas]|uniref:Ribonuclease 3 n=1 Tax=Pseudoxanthomonas winnipegensis TaxID=2480810 RepID=A0A4Q8LFM2_9GAMM|nr:MULTISPECIES: ribonuclease III [Pseudoxanthomonas]PZP59931.1 MAG: ribonuclease III [Pseudoxanthomonas spadix]TAA28210.1 ribonuclease III [Pseudoxanthomonas winnipegensis]TMN15462.1 ribonuclease III [Pseudoxanthomonas sp. X-1]UAY73606.1 ribonuclease III [Pseudoxanthomonas sp. X-1]